MDGPETMIALSAVAMGPLKITFSGGWSGPPENIVLGRSQPLGSQPLIHVMARLKPASSKNMNGFHQLPVLSPSKKTFIVGKTNTDNNYIYIYIYIYI